MGSLEAPGTTTGEGAAISIRSNLRICGHSKHADFNTQAEVMSLVAGSNESINPIHIGGTAARARKQDRDPHKSNTRQEYILIALDLGRLSQHESAANEANSPSM